MKTKIIILIVSVIFWYWSIFADSIISVWKPAKIEAMLRDFFTKIENIAIEDEERFWRIHEKIKILHNNAESESNPIIKKVIQDIGKYTFNLNNYMQGKKTFLGRNPEKEDRYWSFQVDENWISFRKLVEWPGLTENRYLENSDNLNLDNLRLVPTYEWSHNEYITDWERIFFEDKELIEFDISTLQMLPKSWVKDKNSVWYYGKKEIVRDVQSFNWSYQFDEYGFYDFYEDNYTNQFKTTNPKFHIDWYVIDGNKRLTLRESRDIDPETLKIIDK